MKRVQVALLMAAGLLGLATQVSAACGRFGTQLECDLGRNRLLSIGTQRAEPSCAPVLGALPLQGCEGLPADGAVPGRTVHLELQNVGADPGLCRKIGNETYCY